MPVAGRSRMPSWHPLTACPLRFAILASLAPIARLSGTGSPSLSLVAQVVNLCAFLGYRLLRTTFMPAQTPDR